MSKEGIRTQEAVNCLLCETKGEVFYPVLEDKLFKVEGAWSLLRCPRCGLAWLNPRCIAEDINNIYADYWTRHVKNKTSAPVLLWEKIKPFLLASSFGYRDVFEQRDCLLIGRLLWLFPFFREAAKSGVMWLEGSDRGKLLDVGCGNGNFLNMMRNLGWEVSGIELSRQLALSARERFGIPVTIGTLEDANLPSDYFDVITMSRLIEHVYNPIKLLNECRRIIKQGGKIVIRTPNIESLGHKIFRDSCVHLDPPRHIFLFNAKALDLCVKRAGFRVERLNTTAGTARWAWVGSRLIRQEKDPLGKKSLALRLEGAIFELIEYGSCLLNNAGEELALIATKL